MKHFILLVSDLGEYGRKYKHNHRKWKVARIIMSLRVFLYLLNFNADKIHVSGFIPNRTGWEAVTDKMYILFVCLSVRSIPLKCDKWTVMGSLTQVVTQVVILTYRIHYLSDIHGLQTLTSDKQNLLPHSLPVWHPWPANIDIRHVNVDCLMCCVAMTEGELLTLHLIGLYNILSHHVVPSPSTRYMVCYWWFSLNEIYGLLLMIHTKPSPHATFMTRLNQIHGLQL